MDKKEIIEQQDGLDAYTGEVLPEKESLTDMHRPSGRAAAGETYDEGNAPVLLPQVHMEEHGILRLREESLEELKTLVDDRKVFMKTRNAIANKLLAYERKTDHMNEETVDGLKVTMKVAQEYLDERTKRVVRWIKEHRKEDTLIDVAMNVFCLGAMTVAGLTVYIDLEKAQYASSTWKYTGLDKPSYERYTKGEASGGNKTLRTILYNAACAQMKLKGPYREDYDRVKDRLSFSEKETKSNTTQGARKKMMWKDTKPSHRHGAALRKVMKLILVHYWKVGRILRGLPTPAPYVEAQLGHTHIIEPEERGWNYRVKRYRQLLENE